MSIPLGVLWDFLGITTEFLEVRKRIKELRTAFDEKRKRREVNADLILLEEALDRLDKSIKQFSEKHLKNAFGADWAQVLERERSEESIDRSKDLKILFVLSDVWERLQELKRDFKNPEMTDDEIMRELFNMAKISNSP